MLFDLRGKRRRAVQVTYASLALLMAVGLVGAGVGSDVSGGIFDIFTGDDGADVSDANKETQKRIDSANEKLKANPRDQAALVQLVRLHYTIAAGDTDSKSGEFGDDGKKELEKASDAWKRYLALKPKKVDAALAGLMLQAYDRGALDKPAEGTTAAELVADERADAPSYLKLAELAFRAGQTRKGELAGEKALELASPQDKKAVKELIKQYKQGGTQQPQQGGATPPVQPGG